MRRIMALALLFGLAAVPAAAQTTIGAPGGSEIFSWGKPDTQTYGQTFTAVADNRLDNFSFWLGAAPDLQFQAYVFAWDQPTLRATGSALFTSAIMSGPSGPGFHQVTVNTGGIFLNPGSMYVAFLSTSGLGGSGQNAWEANPGNAYAGGAFVFINNGENQNAWTNQGWTTNWQGEGRDLRFEMNFNRGEAVPEPMSMLLLGTGLAGMALVRRRRRTIEEV